MFSYRYHLTASALARTYPSMMSLVVWIMSFNPCRTSLLLLLSNVFLDLRAVYFTADSAISGVFQSSACLIGTPPTFIFSTINFLGVQGPFLEVGPSSIVWRNCQLTGRVGAFSELLKCSSKLLAQFMALPQWGHFSFLMDGWMGWEVDVVAIDCCWLDLKRNKIKILSSLTARANIQIYRHAQLRKKKKAGLSET